MDKIIQRFPFERHGGLCYCEDDGVAYQEDMRHPVPYEFEYFRKYRNYEHTALGRQLNRYRVQSIAPWARGVRTVDIGIGCGTFVKAASAAGLDVAGFDINPVAKTWLEDNQYWADPYKRPKDFMCWTFWDSLEHIPDPGELLEKIGVGSFVFISMPIFNDLQDIKKSKHYRPDEHFYYFTVSGFLRWMRSRGFQIMRFYDFETRAGREGIKTFQFERVAKHNFNRPIRHLLADLFGRK